MNYTIVFKSGHRLSVFLEKPEQFIEDYCKALDACSDKNSVFYAPKNYTHFIQLTEVVAIFPSDRVAMECL